jgi:hypothetical protein
MPRKSHPEFGTVNERWFPLPPSGAPIQARLEAAKQEGLLLGFEIGRTTFVLWRPWLQGETLDEIFRTLSAHESVNLSRDLFRMAQKKLDQRATGHGALHARNIVVQNGVEFVDASFNSVRLNPHAISNDDPWLWGPCIPKGWSLQDWDQVSLLRTAALLAQEPSTWEAKRTREEVAGLCRQWAADFNLSAPKGADFLSTVAKAVELLPAIVAADFDLPPFPLEAELQARVDEGRLSRILAPQMKKELEAAMEQLGLNPTETRQHLQAWMLRHGVQPEQDLLQLADQILRSGLDGKIVSARACAAAERLLTQHGAAPEEAAARVRDLLRRGKWLDERPAEGECRTLIAEKLKSSEVHVDEETREGLAAALAQRIGYPPVLAQRLVDLELERRLLDAL